MKYINPWEHHFPGVGPVPLSHAIVCTPKETMYCAGQIAEDPETNKTVGIGDLVAQMKQVFENIKRVLEAGGFSLKDVVKRQTFLSVEGGKQMRDPEKMLQAIGLMEEYFGDPHPIHSFWIAHELAHPEYLIEVEVTAIKE